MAENGIGARMTRREDQRFLRGKGTYVDDINRPGQNYAVFVRSPHAHATINAIDTAAASAAPGVVAIFVGEDMVADGVGPLICGWAISFKDGSPMNMPMHMPLSVGKVTYVGDAVAVVIAKSLQQAKDAAEQVTVDWGELPAVIGVANAEGGVQLHENAPNNVCFDWHLEDNKAAVEQIGSSGHLFDAGQQHRALRFKSQLMCSERFSESTPPHPHPLLKESKDFF